MIDWEKDLGFKDERHPTLEAVVVTAMIKIYSHQAVLVHDCPHGLDYARKQNIYNLWEKLYSEASVAATELYIASQLGNAEVKQSEAWQKLLLLLACPQFKPLQAVPSYNERGEPT